jgi:hypothetical protein
MDCHPMSGDEAAAVPLKVESIDDLLILVELTDVVFFEVSAKRAPVNDPGDSDPDGSEGHTSIDVAVRLRELGIDVRCISRVLGSGGEYVSDAAAMFTLAKPATIPDEVLAKFVQRVGVMAVYPYLRESITASASKLRLDPPILKLLRSDDIHISQLRQ